MLLANSGAASPPKFAEAVRKPHPRSHLAGTKASYTTVCGNLCQKQWVCGGSLVREYGNDVLYGGWPQQPKFVNV